MSELDPRLYTVAWLAPLEIEAQAALHMLENRHKGRFPLARGDDYVFQAGDMCGHNVIIATLPAGQEYGTGSAAALASQIKKFFPNLWFGLLVGVAAGLPNVARSPPLDIRLGDVLVGLPTGESAGLIAYDLGKETGNDGFQPLRCGQVLANTETIVRSAIGSIKLSAPNDAEVFFPYYETIKYREHSNGTFIDPGQEKDKLYQDDSGVERLVEREMRPDSKRTRVWYGPIGSGEKLIKNARIRNELRDKYNVIGLEMEAAGTLNRIPVGVIRGVCDYGDEHKTKEWQPYAAAMAAAYAKAVLYEIQPKIIAWSKPTSDYNIIAAQPTFPGRQRPTMDYPHQIEPGYEMDSDSKSKRDEGSSLNEEQKQKLLDSLEFDQIDARYMTIKKHHVKTCKWLLKNTEYIYWLDASKLNEHHGFLWIKGKPGAGKSTLVKFALANAYTTMRDRVIISFFFNARGVDLEKSTMGMYRSLLFQLLKRAPECKSVLNSLRLSTSSGRRQWSIESLKELFEQAVQSLRKSSKVLCFIDALDECDKRQIQDMISFFRGVGKVARKAKILFQVCFSSRHYPHITIRGGLSLIIEEQEGHHQDIIKYVDSELDIGRSKVAEQIRADLLDKASGTFIWVVLVVEILNEEYDSGHIHVLQKRFQAIPGDLHELFRDILERDRKHRDKLLVCVQWVLFTRQPLHPVQLYFAILSGVEPDAISKWNPDEITIDDTKRFILNSSKGLVQITRSRTPIVQFIHESVRDFLLKDGWVGAIWIDLKNNFEGHSHEQLKNCCTKYMSNYISAHVESDRYLPKASLQDATAHRISTSSSFPFLQYAVQNVLYHADMAEGSGITQEIFFQSFPLSKWIRIDNIFKTTAEFRHTENASLLYILAEYSMPNLIKTHPSVLSYLDMERERCGPPLFAALTTGKEEVIRIFVESHAANLSPGSWLHSQCSQFYRNKLNRGKFTKHFKFSTQRTILSYLAELGNKVLFALALETRKFKPDLKDEDGRTPLSYAIMEGHFIVVKLLLETGEVDINSKDSDGRTPLSWAAGYGWEDVVKLLLETGGVDVDSKDVSGRTPLSWAAQGGWVAVVNLLLETCKVDINLEDSSGRTPLSWAMKSRRVPIVKLLFETGKAVDSNDSDVQDILSWAIKSKQLPVVKLLLENTKIDIDSKDTSGRTPLSWAAGYGWEAIVKLILETRKVDIDSKDAYGRTPLSWAARDGWEAVVKLLLETGKVDLNSRDASGRTPLSCAAQGGWEAIVNLLLETDNVDVNVKDSEGWTPLSWAMESRRVSTVKLLLETGKVDVNSKDYDGRTPLSWAAQSGWVAVVKLLLETDKADVNSKDPSGRTPLLWAAGNGLEAVVKLLLRSSNVDTDSKDSDGRTPLSWAAGNGFEAVVELLLKTGKVDVNSKDFDGQTPLSWANRSRKWAMFKLLADAGATVGT